MNIVFTGYNSCINEWAEVCSRHNHKSYAIYNEHDEALSDIAAEFSDEVAPVIDLIVDLSFNDSESKGSRLDTLCVLTPRHVPILANTVYETTTTLAKYVKYPELLVGMAYLPSILSSGVVEVAISDLMEKAALLKVQEFIASLEKEAVLVEDYPGMVFPRVLATIVNEAFYTLQQGVATSDAIDQAMRLGVNYPSGPIEWGKRIGFGHIYQLLKVLQEEYGDDRYRPAPLLKKYI